MYITNHTNFSSDMYYRSYDFYDDGIILLSIFFGIIFLIILTLCINYNCCKKKRMEYQEPLL